MLEPYTIVNRLLNFPYYGHCGDKTAPRATWEFDEENSKFKLLVELAGIPKDKVKVKATDEYVEIEAKNVVTNGDEKTTEKVVYHQKLRFHKRIDPKAIVAKHEDGLLTIDLPLQEGSDSLEIVVN